MVLLGTSLRLPSPSAVCISRVFEPRVISFENLFSALRIDGLSAEKGPEILFLILAILSIRSLRESGPLVKLASLPCGTKIASL